MDISEVDFREACDADVPGIFAVRTSVHENLSDAAELAESGITQASVVQMLNDSGKAWVAEHGGRIVAFSIADREIQSIFGLFVRPGFEGIGIGSRLLDQAVGWLWESSTTPIWLATGPNTHAAQFYRRRGWVVTGVDADGDLRLERTYTASPTA